MHLTWAFDSDIFFRGRSSNSYMTILRHFHGYYHINKPCVFAPACISISYVLWSGRLNDFASPLSLDSDFSLVILVLFLSLFNSTLKLSQWTLAIPVQISFSSFVTGMPLLPAGSVLCKHMIKNL